MRRAMMRPITSVPPPAAHGTTMVTGCVGQSSADAVAMPQAAVNKPVAIAAMWRSNGMNSLTAD